MPLLGQVIWGHIWIHTVEKSWRNATNVIMPRRCNRIWSESMTHPLTSLPTHSINSPTDRGKYKEWSWVIKTFFENIVKSSGTPWSNAIPAESWQMFSCWVTRTTPTSPKTFSYIILWIWLHNYRPWIIIALDYDYDQDENITLYLRYLIWHDFNLEGWKWRRYLDEFLRMMCKGKGNGFIQRIMFGFKTKCESFKI